jgi:hypothetical protein
MAEYDDLLAAASKSKERFAPLAADESDNDYLGRLTQAVSGSTKDDFDAMSTEAQAWFDKAADALNAGEEIPVPPGYDRSVAQAARPRSNGQAIGRPTRQTRRGRANGSDGEPSVSRRIRQCVIEDQTVTTNGIIEKLKSENLPDMTQRRSTVSTLRYDTLRTLTLAQEAGWHPPQGR